MSIDTGINGNLFAGNYFDMNADHLKGNLKKMSINNFQSLKMNEKNQVLELRPKGEEKKASEETSEGDQHEL